MPLDPYSLCPCGSGKKTKFCCADIANEMIKALQLHESGQSKAALKILDKLYSNHPSRSWVATSLAGVQLYLENAQAARETLEPLLAESPDHPLGRILDATAALDLHGFDDARKVIHRGFMKGVKSHPEMVGSLAEGIATLLYAENRIMAARQHLALAMRFVRDQDRQAIFMRLLDLDGDGSIPYPLRGVHNVRPLELEEPNQDIFKKALRLSSLGCWHEAALVSAPLLDKYPDNADLSYNVALFHAWDGNETAAAKQFEQAATQTNDRSFAVSCETLAQLLHVENAVTEQIEKHYLTESLSRLLTVLDDQPQLVRVESPPSQDQSADDDTVQFLVLDRPAAPLPDTVESISDLESIPVAVGSMLLHLQPEDADSKSSLCRISIEPEHAAASFNLIEQAAADLVSEQQPPADSPYATRNDWTDYVGLDTDYFPDPPQPDQPARTVDRMKIGLIAWDHAAQELWPQRPLAGLDGLTPQQARDKPEMAIKLAAAINVLDSHANKRSHPFDATKFAADFGIEPLPDFVIEDDAQLNSCDVLTMLRIPIESLNPTQLSVLLNRAQLIQHANFNERLFAEVIKHPGLVEPERMTQIFHVYIDFARNRVDLDEALARIQQAKTWSAQTAQRFEEALQWELRELQLRVLTPDDSQLADFLMQLHTRFLRKMPDLEEMIVGFLTDHRITPPWRDGARIVTADSIEPQSPGTLASSAAPPAEPGKLWLPGQD